jgi:outer membrane protein TolC
MRRVTERAEGSGLRAERGKTSGVLRSALSPLPVALMLTGVIASRVATVDAQEPLQLATLQREALDSDPRVREFALQNEQSGLRVRNIEVERRPAVSTLGQVQYQSDVPQPPPIAGQLLFSPPKDTYDISVRVDQRLFDPALQPRLALARADLAESQARLRVALFTLRDEVNEAFFSAALLQEQIGALGATLSDLEAKLRETTVRVREGAAIPGDAAAIEATLLQQRQQDEELRANRRAALARLTRLTGRSIESDAVLALPVLDDAVSLARQELDRVRARPEYEQFARARDRAARQQDLSAAAERPQVSAFGRAGFGKPGLNFISDQFESYALAGVQLQWKTWTWGSADRERDALKLQQQIVSAEEAAFTERLHRAVQTDLAAIDRLQNALTTDDRIIALRDDIDRVARVRFGEGVITASGYLDRDTERLTARFAQSRHRVELAQARARLLTTLGLEVP